MKICISSYSLHYAFENRLLTAETFASFCKNRFGVTQIEFFDPNFLVSPADTPAPSFAELTPDHPHVIRVRDACRAAGVTIRAIAAENDFTDPKNENRNVDLKRIDRWIDLAPVLGAHIIRINTGFWFHKDGQDAQRRLIDALRGLGPKAKANGITLAIENHPTNLENLEDAGRIVAIIDELSEYPVAACPDNDHVKPEVRFECMELLLPKAAHCHAKFHLISNNREPDIDYDKFVRLLRAARYDASVSIEAVRAPNDDDPLFLYTIPKETINGLDRDVFPSSVLRGLYAIEGSVFSSTDALRTALSRHLSKENLSQYFAPILRSAARLDAEFELSAKLTDAAVQLLSALGVEL